MPGRYRDRLVSHISHESYTPKPIPLVAKELNIEDVKEFAWAVRELSEEGVVDLSETG